MSLRVSRPFLSAVTIALASGLLLAMPAIAQKSSPSNDQRIQRVEANLVSIPMSAGQPLQFNLQQLMDALKVPGLTVTVIDGFKKVHHTNPFGTNCTWEPVGK